MNQTTMKYNVVVHQVENFNDHNTVLSDDYDENTVIGYETESIFEPGLVPEVSSRSLSPLSRRQRKKKERKETSSNSYRWASTSSLNLPMYKVTDDSHVIISNDDNELDVLTQIVTVPILEQDDQDEDCQVNNDNFKNSSRSTEMRSNARLYQQQNKIQHANNIRLPNSIKSIPRKGILRTRTLHYRDQQEHEPHEVPNMDNKSTIVMVQEGNQDSMNATAIETKLSLADIDDDINLPQKLRHSRRLRLGRVRNQGTSIDTQTTIASDIHAKVNSSNYHNSTGNDKFNNKSFDHHSNVRQEEEKVDPITKEPYESSGAFMIETRLRSNSSNKSSSNVIIMTPKNHSKLNNNHTNTGSTTGINNDNSKFEPMSPEQQEQQNRWLTCIASTIIKRKQDNDMIIANGNSFDNSITYFDPNNYANAYTMKTGLENPPDKHPPNVADNNNDAGFENVWDDEQVIEQELFHQDYNYHTIEGNTTFEKSYSHSQQPNQYNLPLVLSSSSLSSSFLLPPMPPNIQQLNGDGTTGWFPHDHHQNVEFLNHFVDENNLDSHHQIVNDVVDDACLEMRIHKIDEYQLEGNSLLSSMHNFDVDQPNPMYITDISNDKPASDDYGNILDPNDNNDNDLGSMCSSLSSSEISQKETSYENRNSHFDITNINNLNNTVVTSIPTVDRESSNDPIVFEPDYRRQVEQEEKFSTYMNTLIGQENGLGRCKLCFDGVCFGQGCFPTTTKTMTNENQEKENRDVMATLLRDTRAESFLNNLINSNEKIDVNDWVSPKLLNFKDWKAQLLACDVSSQFDISTNYDTTTATSVSTNTMDDDIDWIVSSNPVLRYLDEYIVRKDWDEEDGNDNDYSSSGSRIRGEWITTPVSSRVVPNDRVRECQNRLRTLAIQLDPTKQQQLKQLRQLQNLQRLRMAEIEYNRDRNRERMDCVLRSETEPSSHLESKNQIPMSHTSVPIAVEGHNYVNEQNNEDNKLYVPDDSKQLRELRSTDSNEVLEIPGRIVLLKTKKSRNRKRRVNETRKTMEAISEVEADIQDVKHVSLSDENSIKLNDGDVIQPSKTENSLGNVDDDHNNNTKEIISSKHVETKVQKSNEGQASNAAGKKRVSRKHQGKNAHTILSYECHTANNEHFDKWLQHVYEIQSVNRLQQKLANIKKEPEGATTITTTTATATTTTSTGTTSKVDRFDDLEKKSWQRTLARIKQGCKPSEDILIQRAMIVPN